jgi:putative two-component system response regulator
MKAPTPGKSSNAAWASSPRRGRILVIDDEPANVALLQRILERAGYTEVKGISDSRQALALMDEFRPDLVLLDLRMPHLDGFGVLEALKPHLNDGNYLPVLTLTADATDEMKEAALSRGAKDFLAKPFNPVEVLLRVQNLLETRFLYLLLQEQNSQLEQKVRERTRELEEAQIEVLERLARAAEFRDDDTARHTRRVGDVAAQLGRAMGLDDTQVELIRRAAPLHDVGKIATPDSILLKPGPLTSQEWEVMRMHTLIGARMLSGGSSILMQVAERVARSHHERWDGTGYPHALKGEAIPIEARLVAVADVLDALTHDRPYRKAWPLAKAMAEIAAMRGTYFDPRVVDALMAMQSRNEIALPQRRRRGTPRSMAALGLAVAMLGTGPVRPVQPQRPTVAVGRITGRVEVSTTLAKRRANFRIYGDASMPASDPGGSASEMANVVIYLESNGGAVQPTRTDTMAQLNERFAPHVLPVTQGSTVTFPNRDDVFHNVFSLSSASQFDLGRYPKGASKTVQFDKPGMVQVFCHIHSDMSAIVLVLPNGHFARPDAEGRFAIDSIPPGEYRAVGWHERVKPIVKTVTITAGRTTTIDFNIPIARGEGTTATALKP